MTEYKTVRLGDVCEIAAGGTPSRSKTEYWKNGTIPWVKISDFSGKYLNSTTEHITQQGLDNSSAKLFSKGTILYSIFATLGEATILNIDATTNQAIAGIKIKDEATIDIDYFYSYLKSLKDEVTRIGRGVAQSNINLSILKSFTLQLPPLETQKQIATTLDKVSKIIAENKELLEKYDLLIKSRFIEMFGENPVESGKWRVEKLGKLVAVTSSKRIYAEEQSVEGIPFLRISDLVSKINGNDTCDLLIPKEKYNDFLKNGLVPSVDDILVTSRGTLGLCYTITANDKFYFQDGMITWLKFYNHNDLLSIFLSCLFKVVLKKQIDSKTNGATVKYVSISELKELQIPVPPLALQQQFAQFVQQIDKSKFTVQKSLEKAEILYKSLMHEYFFANIFKMQWTAQQSLKTPELNLSKKPAKKL